MNCVIVSRVNHPPPLSAPFVLATVILATPIHVDSIFRQFDQRLNDIYLLISQLQHEAHHLRNQKAAFYSILARLAPIQTMPHLSIFNGNNLEDWLNQADAKLDRDGAAMGDNRTRFDYLFSFLSMAIAQTLLGKYDENSRNPQVLGEMLMARFGISKDKLRVIPGSPEAQATWEKEHRCKGCGSWMHSKAMCPQAMSTENLSRLDVRMTARGTKRRRCEVEGKGKGKEKEVVLAGTSQVRAG